MDAPREFPNAVEAWKYLKKKSAVVKSQELRQKIADNIRLIRSRKKNDVTITPLPSDLQEESFAQLERNGIWEQVLTHVTDPSDIMSACMASDVFRKHLEKKQMMMYLPKVFGVLREREYLCYVEPDADSSVDDEDDEESDNKDVLNQRLVSKEWKKAAEEQLLEPIGFSHPDWHLKRCEVTNEAITSGPIPCKFGNTVDVKLAVKALNTSHLCSSLLRTLEVDDAHCRDQEGFYEKLGQFLDAHGKSVWTLRFTQSEGRVIDGGRYNYKDFWNCVSRMPNLKEMHLCFAMANAVAKNEEKRLLEEFPFPTLPSLKRLTIYEVSTDKLLAAEMMLKNPSLKTVSLNWSYPEGLWNDLFHVLSGLRLECFDFNVAERDHITIGDIHPLMHVQWPLRALNLERACLNDIPSLVDASDVFSILNQFSDTLEEISLDSMKLKDDDEALVVHFPNLKEIENVSIEI